MQDTFARALGQSRATIGYLVYKSQSKGERVRALISPSEPSR